MHIYPVSEKIKMFYARRNLTENSRSFSKGKTEGKTDSYACNFQTDKTLCSQRRAVEPKILSKFLSITLPCKRCTHG